MLSRESILGVGLVLGLTAAAFGGPVQAQAPALADATDVTAAEIGVLLDRLRTQGGVDLQAKVLDIGGANVGVGVLHRGTLQRSENLPRGLVHRDVAEVYYIISGGGTLVTGGTLEDAGPLQTTGTTAEILVGPSFSVSSRGGHERFLGPGDVVVIPPRVFHGFVEIPDHVSYLSIRVDPDKYLPAGYVNPSIQ